MERGGEWGRGRKRREEEEGGKREEEERGRKKGKRCERRMIQVHKYSKKDYQYFPSYSFKNSY